MIKCTKFTSLERGALKGFADLALDSGMIIHDALVMESHGKRWVNLPAKPQLDADKRAKVGEDGKIAYMPVVSIPDRDRREVFSNSALNAIDAFRQQHRSGA
jgi:hypothetical protein